MEFTIYLMPDFDSTREEMGFEEDDDVDSDAVLWQQGYNMQQMSIEPGEKFTIGHGWESATLKCDGNMIKLIAENKWEDDIEGDEHINLNPGNYFFMENGTEIRKLDDIDDENF